MATLGVPEKQDYGNLSQSQKESAYFNMDQAYDPAVYETDFLGLSTRFFSLGALNIGCSDNGMIDFRPSTIVERGLGQASRGLSGGVLLLF